VRDEVFDASGVGAAAVLGTMTSRRLFSVADHRRAPRRAHRPGRRPATLYERPASLAVATFVGE
jgi:hypothetical protein